MRFDDTNTYHPLNWLPSQQQQPSAIHHMHAAMSQDFASPYFMHQTPAPTTLHPMLLGPLYSPQARLSAPLQLETGSLAQDLVTETTPVRAPTSTSESSAVQSASTKRKNFSISAILAY